MARMATLASSRSTSTIPDRICARRFLRMPKSSTHKFKRRTLRNREERPTAARTESRIPSMHEPILSRLSGPAPANSLAWPSPTQSRDISSTKEASKPPHSSRMANRMITKTAHNEREISSTSMPTSWRPNTTKRTKRTKTQANLEAKSRAGTTKNRTWTLACDSARTYT